MVEEDAIDQGEPKSANPLTIMITGPLEDAGAHATMRFNGGKSPRIESFRIINALKAAKCKRNSLNATIVPSCIAAA